MPEKKREARSVFYDLFDAPYAMEMEMRSKVYGAVLDEIARRKMKQKRIAEALNIHQPTVSDLLRGKIDKFSLGRLVTFAGKLGLHVTVTLGTRPAKKQAAKAVRAAA
jgi:predicted XRE-type DNA-binding protein